MRDAPASKELVRMIDQSAALFTLVSTRLIEYGPVTLETVGPWQSYSN